MDYQAFKDRLKECNLSIKEFAHLTGLNEKTIPITWRAKNKAPKWAVSWLENYSKAQTLKLLQKEFCKSQNTNKE